MRALRALVTLGKPAAFVTAMALLIVGAAVVLRVSEPSDARTPAPPSLPLRPAQPSAVISEAPFRFGSMLPRAEGQHVWPIANVGGAPLQVHVVQTGACCKVRGPLNGKDILGEGESLMIPPGGKAKIAVEWMTHKAAGPFRRFAELGTNDPKVRSIILSIEGQIEPARQDAVLCER